MDIQINMNLDNEAFFGCQLGLETATILRLLADKIDGLNELDAMREAKKENALILKDTNGNTVGKAIFTI